MHCPCPTQFSVAKIPSPRPGLWSWKGIIVLHDPHLIYIVLRTCLANKKLSCSCRPPHLHQGSSASLKRPASVFLNSQTKINNFFSKSDNQ